MSEGSEESQQKKARRTVVYACLKAAARLAADAGVSASDMAKWAQLAHFDELRSQGLTIAEACSRLSISAPTGARLSRALKSDFLASDEEHELPKQIAFMLWSGPMSRARLRQVMPHVDPKALDSALALLLEEGRVVLDEHKSPRYSVQSPEDRLVKPGWSVRLGALNSLLTNVVDVVQARFFAESASSFARTLSFRIRADDEPELKRFYEEVFWPRLSELDAKARDADDDDDLQVAKLSILWDVRERP